MEKIQSSNKVYHCFIMLTSTSSFRSNAKSVSFEAPYNLEEFSAKNCSDSFTY